MEKYLITGFSGFVSRHFLDHLNQQKKSVAVLGLDINTPDFDLNYSHVHCAFRNANLLNRDDVNNVIYEFQPNYILHLASFSSVAYSWKNPVLSFANNTNIFLNLLEQIRSIKLKCRILSIGSSEEYGNVQTDHLPLTETTPLNPLSPYAVARVSQEMLSKIYVDGYGLDVVITRSFNHIGPGQKDIFVVSSFAKQLVELKNAGKPVEISTGDLTIVRDFTDVRDVVKAYYLLLHKGQSGEIYNVCSNRGVALSQVVSMMGDLLNISVTTNTDPALIRPNDNRIIIGCNKKIKEHTGWQTSVTLEESLGDLLTHWEKIV